MDKDAVMEVTAFLVSATLQFGPREMDRAQLLVWHDSLRDVTRDEGLLAVRRWVQQESRFPTPADIRALARLVRREQEPAMRVLPTPPRSDQLLWKARMQALREMTARIGHGGGAVTHTESHVGCPGCAGLNARVEQILAEMHRGVA